MTRFGGSDRLPAESRRLTSRNDDLRVNRPDNDAVPHKSDYRCIAPKTCWTPDRTARTNLAGKVEASGVLAVSGGSTTTDISGWLDITEYEPVKAVSEGGVATLSRYSTSVYDESGMQLEESRAYFLIPTGGSSPAWVGADGNRLTAALRGDESGGSITLDNFHQEWTLEQTGNWELFKNDLNGDNDWTDASELNDDRTHNVVNELTARDTDDNGTDNYTLTYTAAGQLSDDIEHYEYIYDAWGRLVEIENQSFVTVAAFEYNGLGHRIGHQWDFRDRAMVKRVAVDPRGRASND